MGFVREKNDMLLMMDNSWANEKGCKTLMKLIKAYEDKDEKSFKKVFTEYRKCTPVDNATVDMLIEVIRALKGTGTSLGGAAGEMKDSDFLGSQVDLS